MKMSTTHNIEMHKLHVLDVQKVEITYMNDIVNRHCFIKANDSVPLPIRVFHENMFFKMKISATHRALAWGLV